MKKIIFITSILMFVVGCQTTPEVHATKQWEGHYMTVEQFNEKTENIILEKNESIWVLSNSTLARLLKNTAKGSGEVKNNKK